MGKIFSAMATSVDGFITGRDPGPGQGLGVGGEVLHDWYFDGDSQSRFVPILKMSEVSRDYVDAFLGHTGAVIAGRHTYEDAERWGGDRPHPTAALFVLSRRPAPPEATALQTFVSSLEEAVAAAREAAGDLDINLMGGELVTSALAAGLVDELVVHQVPVLLGGGRRFFDELPHHVRLSLVEAIPAPGVLHLHYRVER
jgi:dihydrofolate reductase